MKKFKQKNRQQNLQEKQEGVALVMALIMLLLITVIGVSSVRMARMDTQVSGNSMFSLVAFQGAESALAKTASFRDLGNIRDAAMRSTTPLSVPAAYFNPIETVNGLAPLSASGEVIYDKSIEGSLFNEVANSSEFEYQVFTSTAEIVLPSTGVRDRHTEGLAIQKPK